MVCLVKKIFRPFRLMTPQGYHPAEGERTIKGGAHSLLPSWLLGASNINLLQHHHLPRLHKNPSLETVEVDPTGERACIPPGCFVSGFLLPINLCGQLATNSIGSVGNEGLGSLGVSSRQLPS